MQHSNLTLRQDESNSDTEIGKTKFSKNGIQRVSFRGETKPHHAKYLRADSSNSKKKSYIFQSYSHLIIKTLKRRRTETRNKKLTRSHVVVGSYKKQEVIDERGDRKIEESFRALFCRRFLLLIHWLRNNLIASSSSLIPKGRKVN